MTTIGMRCPQRLGCVQADRPHRHRSARRSGWRDFEVLVGFGGDPTTRWTPRPGSTRRRTEPAGPLRRFGGSDRGPLGCHVGWRCHYRETYSPPVHAPACSRCIRVDITGRNQQRADLANGLRLVGRVSADPNRGGIESDHVLAPARVSSRWTTASRLHSWRPRPATCPPVPCLGLLDEDVDEHQGQRGKECIHAVGYAKSQVEGDRREGGGYDEVGDPYRRAERQRGSADLVVEHLAQQHPDHRAPRKPKQKT